MLALRNNRHKVINLSEACLNEPPSADVNTARRRLAPESRSPCGSLTLQIFSINTVSAFFISYDFLNSIYFFSSLA